MSAGAPPTRVVLLDASHTTVYCAQVRTLAHPLSSARTLAPPSKQRKTQARSAANIRLWSLCCLSLPVWCRCSSTTYVSVSGFLSCYLVCLRSVGVPERLSRVFLWCAGDELTSGADVFLLLGRVDVSLLLWSGLVHASIHACSGMSRTTKTDLGAAMVACTK